MSYLDPGWTLVDHLAGVDPDLLAIARTPDGTAWALTPEAAEARRLLTVDDPLLFAWIYTPASLRSEETGNLISFSRFHLECFECARQWWRPPGGPAEERDAYIAPRGAGKSTLWFKLVPLWAGAHNVVDFIAAFADTATQAEGHLQSFKMELDRNPLLRYDYPLLCQAARRPGGVQMQDNRSMLIAESGFVFAAKGITSSSLGLKVGDRRPKVLLFDDVEPPESEYSPDQKTKRLSNILEAAFPLNLNARVIMVGTTTMFGSIMHDVVRQATEPDTAPAWPRDENIRVHYYPAIVPLDDGTEMSLWAERWALEYLQSIRHTRSYRKNMLNLPAAEDGEYWSEDDFRREELGGITRRILSIDPAVTSKKTSDYTGLAVVGYDPSVKACQVDLADQVRLPPAQLRERVLRILSVHNIQHVLIETNNGGEWLAEVLAPLPAKIVTVHQKDKKEHRAAKVLDFYQLGRVVHPRPLGQLEDQMVAFPKVAHDDLVDAVCSGVWLFLKDIKAGPRPRPSAASYV